MLEIRAVDASGLIPKRCYINAEAETQANYRGMKSLQLETVVCLWNT